MMLPENYLRRPVQSLQTMLQTLSAVFSDLPNVNPDGVYGESTRSAVAAFQQQSGLPVTGLADNDTWNRLAASYLRHAPKVSPAEPLRIVLQPMQTISPGEENLHLYLIQAMLAALSEIYAGMPCPDVTGVYDTKTQRAVSCLQTLSGLEPTGIIDHAFWSHLARLYTLSAGDGTAAASSAAVPTSAKYLL